MQTENDTPKPKDSPKQQTGEGCSGATCSQSSNVPKTSIKKRILTGVHIECEPPSSVGRWCSSIESQARALESWAEEVKDFIRDHRSMDPMHLEVVREYSDLCAQCENEWETMDDEGKTCCAHCGCELEDSSANDQHQATASTKP